MSTDDFVAATLLKATGELSTASFGDDDYSKVVQLGNINIDKWAKEDNWNSLYDPAVPLGTISATGTYDLDDSIRTLSDDADDYVQITCTDGTVVNYQTIAASDLKKYTSGNYCARVGRTLRFNKTFATTDREYGGSLTVPAYLYADHLVRARDTVPVDDPNWLVAMTAADWVQSDVTLMQNRQDFIAEANDLMVSMQKDNRPQIDTVTMRPLGQDLRSW